MARHLLVDGHNYVMRTGLFDPRSQEGSRRALRDRIASLLGREDRATVYWDARRREAQAPRTERTGRVEMIYCPGAGGADEAIVRAIRESVAARGEEIVVVSDDRELCGRAKQLGARILPVPEAERRQGETREGRREPGQDEKPRPSAQDVRHWLREFGE